MLDLLIADNGDLGTDRRQNRQELDELQDQYGWPHRANREQLDEWNNLYNRLDP